MHTNVVLKSIEVDKSFGQGHTSMPILDHHMLSGNINVYSGLACVAESVVKCGIASVMCKDCHDGKLYSSRMISHLRSLSCSRTKFHGSIH